MASTPAFTDDDYEVLKRKYELLEATTSADSDILPAAKV